MEMLIGKNVEIVVAYDLNGGCEEVEGVIISVEDNGILIKDEDGLLKYINMRYIITITELE